MAVSAKKVGLYGTVGFLVAALIIVGVVVSSIELPSMKSPIVASNTGTLIVKVTDAPVDLEELDITIDSVSAHMVDGDTWIDLDFVEGGSEVSFNLLELEFKSMDLCETDVPSGEYNMIKMHITEAEAVYVNGEDEPVPLRVPSEVIKVIVLFEVENGEETGVLIDIQPDWVAISKSNNLRPVLKATVL